MVPVRASAVVARASALCTRLSHYLAERSVVLARVSDDLGTSSAPGFGCLEGVFGGMGQSKAALVVFSCWSWYSRFIMCVLAAGQFGLRRRILTTDPLGP